MTLPITVYHPIFIKHTIQYLQAMCCYCSRLRATREVTFARAFNDGGYAPRDDADIQRQPRHTRAVLSACKKYKQCAHCGAPQPSGYKQMGFTIRRIWDEEKKGISSLAAFLEHTAGVAEPGADDVDETEQEAARAAAASTLRRLTREFNAGDAADMFRAMHPADLAMLGQVYEDVAFLATRHLIVLSPKESPTVVKAEGSRTFSQDDVRAAFASVQRKAATLRDHLAKKKDAFAEARSRASATLLTPEEEELLDWEEGAPRDRAAVKDLGVEHVPGEECAAIHAVASKECAELQQAVAAVLTSEALSDPERQRSKRAPYLIRERLSGKKGRMRHDINGTRVNHAGRGVITPSTTLDIDEVGVPQSMAVVFTVQERVHVRNFARMRRAVDIGPGEMGGATHVDTPEGRTYYLRGLNEERRRALPLTLGSVVRRHLRNGDWILMNRQPTLHRSSIMAMRAVLIPGLTIKFSVTVTTPFNADFDGDEMNIHVLQTVASRAEAMALMRVACNITSPQHNGVNIFPVQDEMLALRELSRPHTRLDMDDMADAFASLRHARCALPRPDGYRRDGEAFWRGRTLLSSLLPPLSFKHDAVTVDRGKLIGDEGLFTRGVIVHAISLSVLMLGDDATARWISDLTRAVTVWVTRRGGLSIGLRDTCVSPEILAEAHARVDDVVSAAEAATVSLAALPEGAMEAHVAAAAEQQLTTGLAVATDVAYRVLQRDLSEGRNVMMRAIAARSKGSKLNATQLIACLGQQIVKGRRPAPRGAHTRVLPHFHPVDPHPAARGFVDRSFREGLLPAQFFFHMQGALEGLVDTACNTADVGYLQRRLGQGLNSYIVLPQGAVGTFTGEILQLMYGGDGMDPQRLLRLPAPFLRALQDEDALVRHAGEDGVPAAMETWTALRSSLTAPLDAVPPEFARVPMDVDAWWRTVLSDEDSLLRGEEDDGASGTLVDRQVSKFEYAVLLTKRVHALEQNAPCLLPHGDAGLDDVYSLATAELAHRPDESAAPPPIPMRLLRYDIDGTLYRKELQGGLEIGGGCAASGVP